MMDSFISVCVFSFSFSSRLNIFELRKKILVRSFFFAQTGMATWARPDTPPPSLSKVHPKALNFVSAAGRLRSARILDLRGDDVHLHCLPLRFFVQSLPATDGKRFTQSFACQPCRQSSHYGEGVLERRTRMDLC